MCGATGSCGGGTLANLDRRGAGPLLGPLLLAFELGPAAAPGAALALAAAVGLYGVDAAGADAPAVLPSGGCPAMDGEYAGTAGVSVASASRRILFGTMCPCVEEFPDEGAFDFAARTFRSAVTPDRTFVASSMLASCSDSRAVVSLCTDSKDAL